MLYRTNPTRLVTAWARNAVHLHHQTSNGMGGRSFLPEAGGLYDQLALTVDALACVASTYQATATPAGDG